MLTIADTLLAEDVVLNLAPETPEAAIDCAARLLMDDERVTDWEEFYRVLKAHPPCRVSEQREFGICIPHARTGAVSEMVMSAVRLSRELRFPECSMPVRYVFCIGVPQAMAADYLRIAGALMRLFKEPEAERDLHATTSSGEFIKVLCRLERKL
ncbi:MAG: hypothetical protein EOP84_18790 [Verrucomicrobiaceae bacterium]|nr:MAG: hypothetical protein EOP84_18790 [Verrucomicrobiaceae bacterium]